jgi:putative ABC transport system permease protein
MLKNYLKIAWRNLLRNKLYSFINIAGLAIGMTCCILIFLYVKYELSYDTYNKKSDRIYRITLNIHEPNAERKTAGTSPPMAPDFQSNFPEIEKFTRLTFSTRSAGYKEKKFYDTRIIYSDSSLFDIFTFPMLAGDPKKCLTAPWSVVLTESTSKKYFGNENGIGKTIQISDTLNFIVTGIVKDVPLNSHFNFDCIISRTSYAQINKTMPHWREIYEDNWFNTAYYSYILLAKGTDYKALEKKLNIYYLRRMETYKKTEGFWYDFLLQPITDIHLRSKLDYEIKPYTNGDMQYIYIFCGTAILILIIACFNFINLSTARSVNRSREIGLRKVIGGTRLQMISQFLGESLLFSIIAGSVSVFLTAFVLPLFNSFLGTSLSINFLLILVFGIVVIGVGLLAGFYPALLMSSFSPVRALRGIIKHNNGDVFFRKGLVVFQFSMAMILIISTLIILKQLSFIQNKNIGLNKEQLMQVHLRMTDQSKNKLLIQELIKNKNVINVSANNFSFREIKNNFTDRMFFKARGAKQNEFSSFRMITVDLEFLKTFQIPLIAGRNFSTFLPNDGKETLIINEAAAKTFGWKDPQKSLGKKIQWDYGTAEVVGVVKDFNYTSLRENIGPLVMTILPQGYNIITMRLKTGSIANTLKEIEKTWTAITVDSPFNYSFIEDDFTNLYKAELKMKSLLRAFTFLSILIACLGLLGLASLTIKQRNREIGIRKVLGSSVTNTVQLLSKDFLRLIVLSIIIASPIAWYIINRWLADFAYKINVSVWIFLFAGILVLSVAFATVSFQAIRAAIANPIKSLRTE